MSTKLKCVIVDDCPFAIEVLKDCCGIWGKVDVVDSFTSPKKFLERQADIKYDFCFLDLFMPELNGIEVARQISRPVVFYTGEESLLRAAINFSPVDILIKPVLKEHYDRVIEKVRKAIGQIKELEYGFFNTTRLKGKTKIKLSEIIWVTVDQTDYRNKIAHLKDGQSYTLIRYSFNELIHVIPKLLQVNKGVLVSQEAILNVTHDKVVLNYGYIESKSKEIFLSRKYRRAFRGVFAELAT